MSTRPYSTPKIQIREGGVMRVWMWREVIAPSSSSLKRSIAQISFPNQDPSLSLSLSPSPIHPFVKISPFLPKKDPNLPPFRFPHQGKRKKRKKEATCMTACLEGKQASNQQCMRRKKKEAAWRKFGIWSEKEATYSYSYCIQYSREEGP